MPILVRKPFWQDDAGNRLWQGDCRSVLASLHEKSVQCVVTSPPYFGMRKYSKSNEGKEIGNEKTVEEFVETLVGVFRGVRRVLRDDGTLWVNLGDGFLGGKRGGTAGAPWRLALALEEDGWTLRQDVIWYKTTAMPDGSATNRLVKAHEYLFLMTKAGGSGYFFDAEAVRNDTGSLRRSVWSVANRGYKGAHYAVFPPEIPRLCTLAGTSQAGKCPQCGSPYSRKTLREGGKRVAVEKAADRDRSFGWSRNGINGGLDGKPQKVVTLGWEKSCSCSLNPPTPCIVLDPFCGSGTTVAVAKSLGRVGWGIDLSEEYLREHAVPRVVTTDGPQDEGRK